MLRIYFLQHWFDLSDPGVEEALYDSVSRRQFAGIDLGCEPIPAHLIGAVCPPVAINGTPHRAAAPGFGVRGCPWAHGLG